VVPLSEIEKRMLLFSEQTASAGDLQARREFDAECDDQQYEGKITKLFRKACAHDKRTVDENSGKEALDALREAEVYALGMVDQTGIPRATSYRPVLSAFDPGDALVAVFEVGVPATGFVIVFDPLGWGVVHSDWVRLAVMLISIGICWFAGKVWGRGSFDAQLTDPQINQV
jgi:hypothetical protein